MVALYGYDNLNHIFSCKNGDKYRLKLLHNLCIQSDLAACVQCIKIHVHYENMPT